MVFLLLTSAALAQQHTQIAAQKTANQCPSICGKPSKLKFCTHVDWSSCRTGASWQEADQQARRRVAWTLNQPAERAAWGRPLPKLERTAACKELVRRLQCLVAFPPCEIAHETRYVCSAKCQQAVEPDEAMRAGAGECHSAGFPINADFCRNATFMHRAHLPAPHHDHKCVDLAYSGPAYTLWVVGVGISIFFSITNSLGINLQKYALNKMQKERVSNAAHDAGAPYADGRSPFRNPTWLCGFILVAMGSLLDFVAFGMAPQTLLAPLAALSLVWNLLLAPLLHGERVTRRKWQATLIIMLGVTSTVIFNSHATPEYKLDDLIRLYHQTTMTAYMVAVTSMLTGMFVTVRWIEAPERAMRRARRAGFERLAEGAGAEGDADEGSDVEASVESEGAAENQGPQAEWKLVHIACYGGIAGTFGGQSVLLAKSTVELIKTSLFNGGDAYTRLPFYLILGGMAVTLLLQISFLNEGLRRFDALLIFPTYQAFWILMSVLGGIMYFQEYTSMTEESKWLFGIGTFVTVCGIAMLLTDTDWSSHARAKASIASLHPARRARSPVPGADKHALGAGGHRLGVGMEDCRSGSSDRETEAAEVELVSLATPHGVMCEAEVARVPWTPSPATADPPGASRRQLAGNASSHDTADSSGGRETRSLSVPGDFKSVKISVRPQQVVLAAETTRSGHAHSASSLPAHKGSDSVRDRAASLTVFEGFSVLSPRQQISPRHRATSYSWSDVDDPASTAVGTGARTSPHEQ